VSSLIEAGEVRESFTDLASWEAFCLAHPFLFDPRYIRAIVEAGCRNGVVSDFLGPIGPENVRVVGENYREGFLAAGFNPRQRAVMDLFTEAPQAWTMAEARIYAHEALSPFALEFRGRYARFLGSEYASDAAMRRALFPIPAIDILDTGFDDQCFDIVLSNDVLEHVPDLDRALQETARILRPEGRLIATFPFADRAETTQRRAVLEDGQVRHLATPEYHGNPMDPEGGSLVFQLPGWDILRRARRVGFSSAEMVFWSSRERGLTEWHKAGVLLLQAIR
jgi:SAM-dependent methyltransferase